MKDIDFKHPLYKQYEPQVTLCNDIYYGIDTALKHVVQRPLEDDEDYSVRLQGTVLANYVERICTTMAGQIFRKTLTFEDFTDSKLNDLQDLDITQFLKESVEYAIRDGKHYMMLDLPVSGGKPYLVHIDRLQLINWELKSNDAFKWVVIEESVEKREGFKVEYVTQYRYIKEDGNIELYQEVEGKGLTMVEEITTSFTEPMIVELSISDLPPLYDIAKINIAHMNVSSVLDNSTLVCMQPSLFTKGLGLDDNTQVKFSTNSTINTDNTEASVEWLELKGESIPLGVDNLKRKEKDMAERALQFQEESKQIKTATQVAQENSESTSRLSDIAEVAEIAINKIYSMFHRLVYLTEPVGIISVSRDFKSATDGSLIIGLNQSVIAGTLSKATYLKALNDAEIINIDDIDAEIEQIDKEYLEPESTDENA